MITARCLLLGLALLLPVCNQTAQARGPGDFWTSLPARPSTEESRGSRETWFALDEAGIARHLSVLNGVGGEGSLPLALPMAEGMQYFEISRSHAMAPELAAKYPQIRTFRGYSIDGTSQVRFELGPRGLTAMLFSPGGVSLIERGEGAAYVSFVREASTNAAPFTCEVRSHTGDAFDAYAGPLGDSGNTAGSSLRTYRTAIATTGEYSTALGGFLPALAAVVVIVNRVNQIYETDLGVHLELVANNDLLIYTNANSDPYNNFDSSQMLTQNAINLGSTIGSANYDLGHVLYSGGGGVAAVGAVCNSSLKAWGVSGRPLPAPTNDLYAISTVAHEMGHQLNANHTLNAGSGVCFLQRNAATAYEIGSGSTLMAYPGICPGENLQGDADTYFHADSLQSIHSYTQTGAGSTCGTLAATGNNPPQLTATANASIPARTPFALTAIASDPDGDPLTYTWEQYDLGGQTDATTVLQDNGSGPLFRSFRATPSPTRLLPRLENILSGTPAIGEVLPSTNRTLEFRVTVRDNRPGGGGVQSTPLATPTVLTVIDTGSAFAVTTGNTPMVWNAGETQTVNWTVAGTDGNGIDCASVDIDFSLNRGLDGFPIRLASAAANDGSHAITVPMQATGAARLRVACSDNIFFDINNADIGIVGGNQAPVLNNFFGDLTYTSNGPPILVAAAPFASISDADSPNFDGGELRLELIDNGESNDRLEIRHQGDAPGQVGVSGASVRFGGVEIGTFSGGVGVQPLVVAFNAAATPAAASVVLRNVTYRSERDVTGTLIRTLRAVISDGDGGSSVGATRRIFIQLNASAFIYAIDSDVVSGTVVTGTPVSYRVTISKPIDLTSVGADDFDNAGTSSIVIGAIGQPQFGVLSVAVTATRPGTLRLRLPANAQVLDLSGVPVPVPFEDDDSYVVEQDPDVIFADSFEAVGD